MLEFDGETNFVEVQETPDFSFASDPGAITLAAWVKVLATGTDDHIGRWKRCGEK